jgi:hypothetical protein
MQDYNEIRRAAWNLTWRVEREQIVIAAVLTALWWLCC